MLAKSSLIIFINYFFNLKPTFVSQLMEQRVVHIHTLFIINICSFFLHKSTEIEHFSN